MAVLVVLFASLLLYRGTGLIGIGYFADWLSCARAALATMFLFTAVAHFLPIRKDLVAMVPPSFPKPELLVTLTGIFEFAGAIGLLYPPARLWAALGLILLLIAMFPANISAARRGVKLGGRPATNLWLRAPMQVLFIVWAWIVR